MKLYLVQHGDACTKAVDPERPLTERGRADVERLAGFLGQAGIRVERVMHSGKLRAVQTAECLAGALAPGVAPETRGDINPDDDPGAIDWMEAIGGGDTLVVGHLPFMGRLVSQLVGGDAQQDIVAYRPGSIVCLGYTAEMGWQIDWLLRPELFRQGPVPG